MHAVVVSVTITDPEVALEELRDQVVPQVSQAPGLVAGYWVRLAGNQGRSIVVFESEEQARTVSEQIQRGRGAVTFDSVDVGEVVGHT